MRAAARRAESQRADVTVRLRRPHPKQKDFIDSAAPRKIIRAGRRSGKTTGIAILALLAFLDGRRVLYATPTGEQIDRFWREVKRALYEPIDRGYFSKNETLHTIELAHAEQRIRAKTAWNADTLRGDYADLLILDEWQLMGEDTWEIVGAPMLLDNNGDAVFVYTPPSLHSRSASKARDPRHAAKMFLRAQGDVTGRWRAFHFTSRDNPHISVEALDEVTRDMSSLAYRQEIMAEDIEEIPGALWTRKLIDSTRVEKHPDLYRVAVGVDPPGGATECGIVAAGIGPCDCRGDGKIETHGFVLDDASLKASPAVWAGEVLSTCERNEADLVIGEANYGGDMVEHTIAQAANGDGLSVVYESVRATRGKAIRGEPVVAGYEHGRIHHVGEFPILEEEMVSWVPGQTTASPNRMDALVWVLSKLMLDNHEIHIGRA